jgi:hypothetical protein
MLFPVHRFSTDAEGRARLTRAPQRAWSPLLVVPRAWCVAETLPARQVRWWEQPGFARLQAQRLAPFPNTAGSAAVRDGQLHLWLWDGAEVDAALADAPPAVRSARRVAQAQVDASSPSWFGPWNRDLLAARAATDADLGPRIVRAATAIGAAGLLATGAYAAYWWGAASGAEERLAALQTQVGERGDKVLALTALSRAEQADRDWIEGYARAGASLDIRSLLRALTVPMEAHGVAIRELEVRQDDVRLILVSAGIEIDLPALVRSLARVPGLADVQLRQNADLSQATLSLRADGYYTAPQRVATR